MSFLFKSKKPQPGVTGLPPANRNIHTSDGAVQEKAPMMNGDRPREIGRIVSPTPSGSVNNSLNSITTPGSPDSNRVRPRAESETQVRVDLSSCREANLHGVISNSSQGSAIAIFCRYQFADDKHQCNIVSLVAATLEFHVGQR